MALPAAGIAAVLLLGGGAVVINQVSAAGRNGPTDASTGATGTPTPSPTPSPTPPPGADIRGPLNLLLVGVDTRVGVPDWEPHADAVLIMHITANLDRAYLFSLPRDLVVDIPAFPKARFRGDRTKLTHAMSYGSRRPGDQPPSAAQGYQLLSRTVSDYTGIKKFDGGAVLTFGGLDNLVDSLGGIDLYVDQRVVSQHRQPNGKHRDGNGYGYIGPQMVYEKGQRRMNGWQALDYARQRYLTGGDYSRQRHHQQLIKAIVARLISQDVTTDPDRLNAVVKAIGKTLVFEGGGQRVIDFAFALSGLTAESITMVALPGHSVGSGGSYRGEELGQLGDQFIAAVRKGNVTEFLAANPKLVVPR
ncbi:LCP family protein [Solwaraspora sp. WMMD1047]|nr:LCP family protein [Solwaraspora sp. WMMD1047]MDG4828536.1 LCP family protein [Solwaraspora sp. WMMD1047]